MWVRSKGTGLCFVYSGINRAIDVLRRLDTASMSDPW